MNKNLNVLKKLISDEIDDMNKIIKFYSPVLKINRTPFFSEITSLNFNWSRTYVIKISLDDNYNWKLNSQMITLNEIKNYVTKRKIGFSTVEDIYWNIYKKIEENINNIYPNNICYNNDTVIYFGKDKKIVEMKLQKRNLFNKLKTYYWT